MGVAVDDRRAAGKLCAQPLLPAGARSGVVHHPDPHCLHLDDAALGQPGAQNVVVHVADHRLDGSERKQLVERTRSHDITRVENEVGLLEKARALPREAARAARQMGVRDDRDERQRLRLGFAFGGGFVFGAVMRNGLLAKTFVRAVFISAWSSVAST
jgi:hypothetical protein